MMRLRSVLLSLLMISMVMSGCYGETEVEQPTSLVLDNAANMATAPRGQVYTLHVEANVPYTVERTPGAFFMDEFGVYRDALIMEFGAEVKTIDILILDTELTTIEFNVTAGEFMLNHSVQLEESSELMLVDGRRAFQTIDMLTSQYNNRWCASASVHEGGSAYEAAAEAMAEEMREMGFDFVEVTRYEDDPNQLNVVGYNWGRVTPDEYIIIGGHFDIAYMFTPPGGGTNEGANDDTSGSTVSLEMAQALAQMEFDHTVVAGLWACEEEGLLGSLAYVEHLPENVSVRAYMNFDMVSLNYPIIPLSEPLIGPGGEVFSAAKYDWTISIAGANQENMERMHDWVGTIIDDDLDYKPTEANPITWEIAESCASDHCAFFSEGYPTFNFFSPGGDISFWQEWHSPSDTFEFMTAKAGGQQGMESGFNSLVWSSLDLFIRVDNAEEFHGTWME
ncbi:MAG TPA: Zn-dependent exopeptidase M28 [Candidatus Poseidoniaceae archaeon]|nr:MAG TPA: M28 family peptidase [Candidatus Poseidoniales archaeon]HII11155.1 Zn-dependent exopeptidase M28 [Candidatus Poseidoniaceae archaeon]|tara:strand:+ start:132 stop:1481 length:1350 start_codon:yes stop_codon:yes gene_type:complete